MPVELAAGRSVGYGYELRCVHGAAYLVLDRHGEAQRRLSGGICWEMRVSFVDAMRYHMASFLTTPSLQVAMNELSNHDHSRFLTRTNHNVGTCGPSWQRRRQSEGVDPAVMREAVVMQMTWPGAPTIYYGDEAGVCGFTDPDNRRTYPWGREDQQMLAFHKAAIAMHKKYPVLTGGSLKFLYEDYNILSYGRFSRRQQIVVVFNNNDSERTISLPVWMAGVSDHQVLQRVFYTGPEWIFRGRKRSAR